MTGCESCYENDVAYEECQLFAYEVGCPRIVMPSDCWDAFYFLQDLPECWAPLVIDRAVNVANLLCGP